jgi:hypothetical protein
MTRIALVSPTPVPLLFFFRVNNKNQLMVVGGQ